MPYGSFTLPPARARKIAKHLQSYVQDAFQMPDVKLSMAHEILAAGFRAPDWSVLVRRCEKSEVLSWDGRRAESVLAKCFSPPPSDAFVRSAVLSVEDLMTHRPSPTVEASKLVMSSANGESWGLPTWIVDLQTLNGHQGFCALATTLFDELDRLGDQVATRIAPNAIEAVRAHDPDHDPATLAIGAEVAASTFRELLVRRRHPCWPALVLGSLAVAVHVQDEEAVERFAKGQGDEIDALIRILSLAFSEREDVLQDAPVRKAFLRALDVMPVGNRIELSHRMLDQIGHFLFATLGPDDPQKVAAEILSLEDLAISPFRPVHAKDSEVSTDEWDRVGGADRLGWFPLRDPETGRIEKAAWHSVTVDRKLAQSWVSAFSPDGAATMPEIGLFDEPDGPRSISLQAIGYGHHAGIVVPAAVAIVDRKLTIKDLTFDVVVTEFMCGRNEQAGFVEQAMACVVISNSESDLLRLQSQAETCDRDQVVVRYSASGHLEADLPQLDEILRSRSVISTRGPQPGGMAN